jgi:UDP-N-acetylmuramoyl-tripeptide--D-alanyl-D-alanine ligase
MKDILKRIIVSILTVEAWLLLKKHKPYIIAITGNVGKTSTKDAIYSVLAGSGKHVRKSEKSFNSEIGVPLTVLGLPNAWGSVSAWLSNIFTGFILLFLSKSYPRFLVLEIGADHPGDIKKIARWVKPDVVVLTAIPDIPVHIEYFKNLEQFLEEKAEIVKALKPEGLLLFNVDSQNCKKIAERIPVLSKSYGYKEEADIYATDFKYIYEDEKPKGMSVKVSFGNESLPLRLFGFLGKHQFYSALVALLLAKQLDIDFVSAAQTLEKNTGPKGRMKILEGIKNSTIIDDTYNASPAAVHAALDALSSLKSESKKLLVLADMLELGKYSSKEHKRVIEHALDIADTVYLYGPQMTEAARNVNSDKIRSFDKSEKKKLIEQIKKDIQSQDLIFLKGSQGMRMEKVVKAIMKKQEDAKDLLVRQESEWLNR